MKLVYATVSGLIGVVAVLGARVSMAADRAADRAAEPPCSGLAVQVDAAVRARWPEVPERIREAFAGRDDIDPCARVAVTIRGASTVVTVTLPDGRFASRSPTRPNDVIPTLEALLLVPQASPVATQPAAPATPAPAIAVQTVTGSEGVDPTRVPISRFKSRTIEPIPSTSRLRLDLSVAMGARIGDGQGGVGFGVLSFLEIAGWLVGFQGRVDAYQGISSGPATGALEFAVLGGRRLRAGTLALDFLVGPALAMQGVAKSVKQVGSTEPAVTTSATTPSPRLLVGAHLNFRAQSTLRTFVGVDGEFGLADAAVDRPPDLPPLPRWSVGLVLGARVGTR